MTERTTDAEIAAMIEQLREHVVGYLADRPNPETGALLREAAALLARLQQEREEWYDCAKYDPLMSGARQFKGWDRSALDRCRQKYIEAQRT